MKKERGMDNSSYVNEVAGGRSLAEGLGGSQKMNKGKEKECLEMGR